MTDSAPPEVASPSTLVARPAASRLAKFLAQLKGFRGPIAAIASIGAILSGIVGYWTAYDTVHHVVVPKSSPAAPGPPIMSVAVMPFTPASASADDERLAERITQDVTSAIERALPYGLVVSHALAVKYKAAPSDSRAAGRELNVRYLVEGDVRPAGGAVVVMARLVETGNGAQVWNDRVTTPLSSSGEGADDIVARLTSRIRWAVYAAEEKRVAHLPQAGANAMELALRGNALREHDHSAKARDAARKLYEEGLRLDPGSTMALLGLHGTLWPQWRETPPSAGREQLMKEMDDVSTRAVRADRNDPRAWGSRAFTLAAQHQWDGAFEANAEALRIDPHRAPALGQRAWLLNLTGRAEEALPVLDQALALDPHSSKVPEYFRHQCTAYLLLGRYDNAISACGKALALGDEDVRLDLVAAYAQKGDMAKAAVEKAELLKRQPKTTIARLNRTWRLWSNNPIWLQQREAHLIQGLRKAGISES